MQDFMLPQSMGKVARCIGVESLEVALPWLKFPSAFSSLLLQGQILQRLALWLCGGHTGTRKSLQWWGTIILKVLHVCFYQLRSFLKPLGHFISAHTQQPLTLTLISSALFPLFVKSCLTSLVTWVALSSWKRDFKGWCVDGGGLTQGLAHRARHFPLRSMATLSTPGHYIWAAAERKEEKAVREHLPHMPFPCTHLWMQIVIKKFHFSNKTT